MFCLVIQGTTSIGDMAMRTGPLPLSVVIGAAARMAMSPTTVQIVPATRANMERWPQMIETERVVKWMYRNRPLPVARWQYEAETLPN
jgi:hypothetical protein